MAKPKTDLFESSLQETAEIFKALSHPARLKILQIISQSLSCISGDISDELPLGRTTVNQHLNELKKIGLIKGHIEGTNMKYCLNQEKAKKVKELISIFLCDLDTISCIPCEE